MNLWVVYWPQRAFESKTGFHINVTGNSVMSLNSIFGPLGYKILSYTFSLVMEVEAD